MKELGTSFGVALCGGIDDSFAEVSVEELVAEFREGLVMVGSRNEKKLWERECLCCSDVGGSDLFHPSTVTISSQAQLT
jgi:hypothetical protein